MKLMMARSKAGHDKGRLYVCLSREGDFCFLADGNLRPIDRPKKKRFKHIQPIYRFPELVKLEIEGLEELKDHHIKRIISLYERALKGEMDV